MTEQKRLAFSVLIAFFIWFGVSLIHIRLLGSEPWLFLPMYFLTLFSSGWIAKKITGINPYTAKLAKLF